MKAQSLLLLLALAQTASAECYLRSSTLNQFNGAVERTADMSRDIVTLPDDRIKCTVTYRALINGAWHTVQGTASGSDLLSENQICAQAQDQGNTRILERIGGKTTASQEMVCTDQPIPEVRVRTVPRKTGEIVRESEVLPHRDITKRASFGQRGVECRWFMEDIQYGRTGAVQIEGVMCRTNSRSDWRVQQMFAPVVLDK